MPRTQTRLRLNSACTGLALVVLACGTSESSVPPASGGQASAGGTANAGGLAAAGGQSPTGGLATSGGTAVGQSSGGSPSGGTATSTPTGGTPSVGGAQSGGAATGGRTTGGSAAGTRATGGARRGGPSSSGGASRITTGGAATGGKSASTTAGGQSPTGGTTGNPGSTTTGGKATGGSATGGSATTGGQSGTGGSSAGGNDGLLVPATGALLGLFTPAQSESELKSTETQVGRKWAIHLGYFDWPDNFVPFAQADIAAGRIPYVTVEPWNVSLDAITSGTEDATIKSRAAAVAGLNGKIMRRFAHEMNGNWYPSDGYHNGANASAPPKYVAAYRHIHDVFASSGVTNVLWVFCPNVDSVPSDSWNQWSNYYPGDSYVDGMGFDGYNWGSDTFASITSRIYPGLVGKNKPIMLGETSTQDVEKTNWINAIIPAMKSQFPQLKALVWFHVNKEQDWRYDSTANSLAAFVAMAKDPYFNP